MSTILNAADADISALVEKLRTNQGKCKHTNAEERINLLRKLQLNLISLRSEIQEALFRDFGKPAYEVLIGEILSTMHEIQHTCQNLASWMKNKTVEPESFPDSSAQIIYEPKGTILIMGPWNFPFYLCFSPLIAAIAAGNNAVIKPSELTPHVSAIVKEIVEKTFDDDIVVVFEGGVSLTTELLKQPFDHIFFTGSPKVGRIVMEAAAKNLTSVTLELGGKNPAIIDETADMDKAVKRILRGKTINAGQVCLSPDYLLIPYHLQEVFIQKTKKIIEEWFYPNGSWDHTDFTQIVNEQNFIRLKSLFDDAIENGAEVAYGGIFDEQARKIHPTILTNVPLHAKIMKEEIFGPLLPIFNYEKADEIPPFIAKFDKPLAFYIFSQDQGQIDYLIGHSTSGGVTTNDVFLHCVELGLPFGGVNSSGIGKYHGKYGFLELSNARGILHRSFESDAVAMEPPPYTGRVEATEKQFFTFNS